MKLFSFLLPATAWLLLGLASLVAARAPGKDALQKELAKFEGTWEFVSIEVDGMPVPAEEVKQSGNMVIKGDKFSYKEGNMITEGTFTLVLDSKPKRVDVTFTTGPDKGKKMLGIYELEGDKYQVCVGMDGKERPKEFVTRPGSGHVLEVLKRIKP